MRQNTPLSAVGMVDQPKVDNLLHLSWTDSMWVPHLTSANVMDYFSERSNPFYSRDCNNEFVKMQQNARPDALTHLQGTEYLLLHAQDPILYIIRKQQRYSPVNVQALAAYHMIAGEVFQTPDIGSLINSRLASAMSHINNSFTELSSYSQYHPSKGYWWRFHNKPTQNIDQKPTTKDKDRKTNPKDEVATLFQRRRVDSLLADLTARFPFKPPPIPSHEASQDNNLTAPSSASQQPNNIAVTTSPPLAPAASIATSAPLSTPAPTASSPLNIKLEPDELKQDPAVFRQDVKVEVKQEIKTEVKQEPGHTMHQFFQRSNKPPPEKRQRIN